MEEGCHFCSFFFLSMYILNFKRISKKKKLMENYMSKSNWFWYCSQTEQKHYDVAANKNDFFS